MSADHLTLHDFDDIAILYRQHHGWLRGWLQRKVGNAFDAADLAQATFLRVLAPRGCRACRSRAPT
jgi:RNA polymerase sigma-70 factor (ECF subfamily)